MLKTCSNKSITDKYQFYEKKFIGQKKNFHTKNWQYDPLELVLSENMQ